MQSAFRATSRSAKQSLPRSTQQPTRSVFLVQMGEEQRRKRWYRECYMRLPQPDPLIRSRARLGLSSRLEREILGRVDRDAVGSNLEVQVRPCRVARRANCPDGRARA